MAEEIGAAKVARVVPCNPSRRTSFNKNGRQDCGSTVRFVPIARAIKRWFHSGARRMEAEMRNGTYEIMFEVDGFKGAGWLEAANNQLRGGDGVYQLSGE